MKYIDITGNEKYATVTQAGSSILVSSSMKESDLVSMVPITNGATPTMLSEVLTSSILNQSKVLSIVDQDGDALVGVSPIGQITATLYKNGTPVNPRNRMFDFCSTYQLKIAFLAITEGQNGFIQAKTNYGIPNSTDYNYTQANQSVTYDIQPDFYACFAKPNLLHGTGGSAGAPEWDPENGFMPMSVVNPAENFPTTGFDGARFQLTLSGTTAHKVISSTTGSLELTGNYSPSVTSSIRAELSTTSMTSNVLLITLIGPNRYNLPISAHTPIVFRLKSDNNKEVYSFKISKWFVPTNYSGIYRDTSSSISVAEEYCKNMGSYRVPFVIEFTNANGVGWTGGLSGQGNFYQRRIGGGVMAEWGDSFNNRYWTANSGGGIAQYVIVQGNTTGGIIGTEYMGGNGASLACVSP